MERGCGERTAGGIYASVGLSPFGSPVEEFLVDPPQSIEGLPVTPVGVKLIRNQKSGRVHIFDWVGGEHYPNVADFVEEVKRMGLSRRLPKNLNYSLLTKESRIVLIHARAIIRNASEYYTRMAAIGCPKGLPEHRDVSTVPHAGGEQDTCVGLYWKDLDPATIATAVPAGAGGLAVDGAVWRNMPSFNYTAKQRPDGIEPHYAPGIFMAMGIQKLEVIKDKLKGTHEISETLAGQSGLPVVTVDE